MKKYFKFSLYFIFSFVVILGALIPAANLALQNEELRNTLLQKFASSLDGKLQAAGLSIALDEKSLNIRGTDLRGSLQGDNLLLDIPDVKIRILYTELLQGSFFPSTFAAVSPHVTWTQQLKDSTEPAALFNWSGELNTLLKKITNNSADIDIRDATLVLASTTLNKLTIKAVPNGAVVALDAQMEILYRETVMPVSIKGTVKNSLTTPFSYGLNLQAQSIPLSLIPGTTEFYFSQGLTNFSGKITGTGKDINLTGSVDITDLDMTVGWTSEDGTRYQKKPYLIPHAVLGLEGTLQNRKMSFSKLDLQSDAFHLQGSFLLDYTSITNPSMDIRFSSDEMTLTTLKSLLPDPLISDWTTTNIFPRLTNGTARITSFKLAGTVAEISTMQQPENYHCLSWSGILKNVDTFYFDHKPLARVQTAHLAMDGDLLTIDKMVAESEQSTLRLGSVSIDKIYENKRVLTVEALGSFSLAWLTKIIKSGLIGEGMQKEVRQISSIAGEVKGNIKLNMGVTEEEMIVNALSGEGTTGSVDLQMKNLTLPLHLQETSFTLAFPGTCTIAGKGLLGKSSFHGTLDLIDLYRKQQFNLQLLADLKELNTLFAGDTGARLPAACITTLPVTVTLTTEKDTIEARGSLQINKSTVTKNSPVCHKKKTDNQLLQADYRLTYSHKKFNLKDVTLRTKAGNIKASAVGTVAEKNKILLSKVRLRAASFPVQALSFILPEQYISFLGGIIDADIEAAKQSSAEDLWSAAKGTFTLKGWHGVFIKPDLTVTNIDIQGTLNRGQVALQGTDLRIAHLNDEYPLLVTADLEKNDLWKGTVRFYGDYIDLTAQPTYFRQGKTDLSNDLPIDYLKIIGRIDHVRYRNLIFSPLLMQTHVTGNKYIISKGLLQLDNDYIWLTGMPDGNDVLYEWYFKLKDKPVTPMLGMMGFENKSITGALDMEGKIISKVTPGATVFDTSTGSISFDIKDGSIESSSALIKILDMVSLENIFDKKDILKWKNTLKFDLIQGKFDLLHGIFTTNSFVMDASAFDLFAEGIIDANDNTMDMKVKLAPFGTLNKLFSSIPYLGFVLTGKSKSLFDYTLSVKGKIDDPDVQYIPLKGTIESLTGYIKRLVSAREKVKKEVNSQLQQDIARKNAFILRMNNELAPLMQGSN